VKNSNVNNKRSFSAQNSQILVQGRELCSDLGNSEVTRLLTTPYGDIPET